MDQQINTQNASLYNQHANKYASAEEVRVYTACASPVALCSCAQPMQNACFKDTILSQSFWASCCQIRQAML